MHDEFPAGQGKMLLGEPAGSHEDIPSVEVNPLGQGMQGVEAPRLLPKEYVPTEHGVHCLTSAEVEELYLPAGHPGGGRKAKSRAAKRMSATLLPPPLGPP